MINSLLIKSKNRFIIKNLRMCKNLSSLSSSSSSSISLFYSNLLHLTSESNDKIKIIKSLQLKKKRQSLNLLLLEGHRQVIDAINGGLIPQHILLSDKAINAPLSTILIESIINSKSESLVYKVNENIMQSLSDTVQCQGVIAAFNKPPIISKLPSIDKNPLIILLDRVSDPGNVGTIIRTAYGLGADAIIVAEGCDPWSPKVLRSAMGLCIKMPIIECDKIPDLSQYNVYLADADENAMIYNNVNMKLPTVIVIGNEADGIRHTLFDNGIKIKIPMTRNLESLNAAVAASIIIAEACKQRSS
jgi:TrmH family RNA methyltransferase